MVKALVKYADQSTEEFSDILQIYLKRSLDTPADSLTLVLPFCVEKELAEVSLFDAEAEFFSGIVDEQITYGGETFRTEIYARSTAALLLDNEACPEVYENPPFSLIFKRYAKVCGLENYVGEDRIYKGRFAVYKGMSCYQVLSTFCQRVYGGSFSFVGRTMYTQAAACEEEICFCTSGEGILCEHIERSYSRCRLISKVLVKLGAEGGYTTTLTDRDSSARGVCRQRYIDASSLSDISLSRAHSVIKEGRLSALQINLVTHRRASDFLGALARAEGDGVSEEGLVVTAVAYTFKDRKELTKITLNSREE